MPDEISVKLGLQKTQFKSDLAGVDRDVDNFSNKPRSSSGIDGLFNGIEHRLFGVRHLAGALAVALGLNLEHIGENIARFVLDFSKAVEEGMKRVAELGQQTEEVYNKIFDKRRTDAEKLKLAEESQVRLLKEVADINATIAAAKASAQKYEGTDGAALANKRLITLEQEKSVRLAEVGKKLADDQLVIDDAHRAILKEAAEKHEKFMKQGEEDARKADAEQKREDAEQKQELEKRIQQDKQIHDLKLAGLPVEKQITQLAAEARTITADIEDKKKRGLDTRAQQIELLKTTNELAAIRTKTEKETADAIEKQNELEKKLAQAKAIGVGAGLTGDEQAQLAEYIRSEGKRGSLPVRTGGAVPTSKDFDRSSDAELKDLIEKNTAQLARLNDQSRLGFEQSIGSVFGATTGSLNGPNLQNVINAARRTLDFRNQFRSNYALGGEDFARSQFSGNPLDFDRVFSQLTQSQDTLTKTVQTIDDRLQAAGFNRRG